MRITTSFSLLVPTMTIARRRHDISDSAGMTREFHAFDDDDDGTTFTRGTCSFPPFFCSPFSAGGCGIYSCNARKVLSSQIFPGGNIIRDKGPGIRCTMCHVQRGGRRRVAAETRSDAPSANIFECAYLHSCAERFLKFRS